METTKCPKCGASLSAGKGGMKCSNCDVDFINSRYNSPVKAREAMRVARDSEMYLKAARYCAYTFAFSIAAVVLIIFATGKSGKNSFAMQLIQVVSTVSVWAAIIFYIIGRIKKRKAKGMK